MSLPSLFPELDPETPEPNESEAITSTSDPDVDLLAQLVDLSHPFSSLDPLPPEQPSDPNAKPPPFQEDPEKELEEYVEKFGSSEIKSGIPTDVKRLLETALYRYPAWEQPEGAPEIALVLYRLSGEVAGDDTKQLTRDYLGKIEGGMANVVRGLLDPTGQARKELVKAEASFEGLYSLMLLDGLSDDDPELEEAVRTMAKELGQLDEDKLLELATDELLLLLRSLPESGTARKELRKRRDEKPWELANIASSEILCRSETKVERDSDELFRQPVSFSPWNFWRSTGDREASHGMALLLLNPPKARRWYLDNFPKVLKEASLLQLAQWAVFAQCIDSLVPASEDVDADVDWKDGWPLLISM